MEHTKVHQPTTLAGARGRRAPRLRFVEPSRLGNIISSSAKNVIVLVPTRIDSQSYSYQRFGRHMLAKYEEHSSETWG